MPKNKILVVEDNRDTRDMMTALLQLQGYVVVSAEDGQAGFEAALVEQPDLVITDVNMPILAGPEMIRLLRQQEAFKSLPIIALTAYDEAGRASAMAAGANQALSKPVEYDSFLANIGSLLGQSRTLG